MFWHKRILAYPFPAANPSLRYGWKETAFTSSSWQFFWASSYLPKQVAVTSSGNTPLAFNKVSCTPMALCKYYYQLWTFQFAPSQKKDAIFPIKYSSVIISRYRYFRTMNPTGVKGPFLFNKSFCENFKAFQNLKKLFAWTKLKWNLKTHAILFSGLAAQSHSFCFNVSFLKLLQTTLKF